MAESDEFDDSKVWLGFVIDGVLEQILETDSRIAAILLSNPLTLEITEKVKAEWTSQEKTIHAGSLYDAENDRFINVDQDQEVVITDLTE